MFGRLTTVAVASALLAGAMSFPAAAQQVKAADELKAIFAGNTAYITHRNGSTQKALIRADGTAKITQRAGAFKEAKWTIEGDSICHDLSTERKCYKVYKKGGTAYELVSHDMEWKPVYDMKPGNPENF